MVGPEIRDGQELADDFSDKQRRFLVI